MSLFPREQQSSSRTWILVHDPPERAGCLGVTILVGTRKDFSGSFEKVILQASRTFEDQILKGWAFGENG